MSDGFEVGTDSLVKTLYRKARELEAREGHGFRPGEDLERLEARALMDRVVTDPAARAVLESLVGPVPEEVVERARARQVTKALSAERQALVAERRALKATLFAVRYSKSIRTDADASAQENDIDEAEARFKEIDEELARLDRED